MFGAIIGSFIATLVLRWTSERSVVSGRSACDGCGRQLRWTELIPLLSYATARGQCPTCAATIDPLHPLTEAGALLIGAVALWLHPDLTGVALALFGWQLLTLALLDARAFWLPDQLTLMLALSGLTLGGLATGVTLADRCIGGVAGFGVLTLIAYAYRAVRGRQGLGGGDPKLFGAIGLWLGWAALPSVLLLAAVAGLGVAALRLVRRQSTANWATMRLPFGTLLALAAGAVALAMAQAGA